MTGRDFHRPTGDCGLGWRLRIPDVVGRLVPLPDPPTPYQARPREEAAVDALIEGGWRVVTVVGPEGSGKTRLAISVARASRCDMAFCELSDDPEGVEQDLLRAVGLEGKCLGDIERIEAGLWILVDTGGCSGAVLTELCRLVQGVPAVHLLVTRP